MTELENRLKHSCVIGAAGKMGRGIALLVAREVLGVPEESAGVREGEPELRLIDPDRSAHAGLLAYIEKHVLASSSRQDGSPEEKSRATLHRAVIPSTDLSAARGSKLVFEAAPENEALKVEILARIGGLSPSAFVLTNTSSIPIHVLEERARLAGRVIGFHFYNPPAVQRLVEIVTTRNTDPALRDLATDLATRLGKRLVPSNDIAGFIGNGHFIREAYHAMDRAGKLSDELGTAGAIYVIDRITRDALLRPMGIFQLIDYVGIDVFAAIADVMSRHIPGEDLRHDLAARMLASGRRGGQRGDGTQVDGFFRYREKRPTAVAQPESDAYIPVDDLERRALPWLEDLPETAGTWRTLRKDPEREAILRRHFEALRRSKSPGAKLAIDYLDRSREIAEKLVSDGVARSLEDVSAVLEEGFHHLYGPSSPAIRSP